MKLVRDVCNNKDIIAVEVGDKIPYQGSNLLVKQIERLNGHRYILLENKKGEVYITDEGSLNCIIG